MSRTCIVTGKRVRVGHNVSHANNKTNRRFLPNLQVVSLLSDTLGQSVRMRLSARGIKTIEHAGGFDAFLLKVALQDAHLDTGTGTTLTGDALDALARKYVTAQSVIERLSNWMDGEALHVLANGLQLKVDTREEAEASAAAALSGTRMSQIDSPAVLSMHAG